MENTESKDVGWGDLKTWLIIFGIAFGFLGWGFLVYLSIGDKGPPAWDYSIIEDIPGQAPYSTRGAKDFSGLIPGPRAGAELLPQHVMEPQNQFQAPSPNQGRK